ncbi:hypothetical protein G3N95_12040 [Paraburkholderia sp. Tr-20389]|uniref:hypothetical protein n=1 Tax=Paraburkholderia sp. Tr-20389 TaxID=2703903 RepID=UPI0019806DA6|nr:hypothetical protein [Paraburkholderia sp. Tr-20389]MBN3753672.1 hypothetical protein [Paraburkholderia sp. Tr-20389]
MADDRPDEWNIERLALGVPGYSEHDTRELARAIATLLGQSSAMPHRVDLPHVELQLQGKADETQSELARRIVASLLRALE